MSIQPTGISTNSCGYSDCKVAKDLKKCGRCSSIFYCGVTHQKADWPKHKPVCQVNQPLPAKYEMPDFDTQFPKIDYKQKYMVEFWAHHDQIPAIDAMNFGALGEFDILDRMRSNRETCAILRHANLYSVAYYSAPFNKFIIHFVPTENAAIALKTRLSTASQVSHISTNNLKN